ncbi:MAG TPA: hypothetical protein VMI94_27700 [Bryobacteraceae bacterium]|nr:hypothetical protein [Bryobacteraceae bacterium]
MSPAKLSNTLQAGFVRTELETGHRMLAAAIGQRRAGQDATAAQSLDLARLALAGAERHLSAVSLPGGAAGELEHWLEELRGRIHEFEAGR